MSGVPDKSRLSRPQGQEQLDPTRVDFLYDHGMKLKDWIRSARKASGLTQEQLGERLGVTKGNVSAWENARHEPSFAQLQQISEISGMALPDAEHISASSDSSKKIHKAGLFSDSNVKSAHNTDIEPRERFDKNVTPAPLGERRIPVISFVQAGMMTEAVDPYSLGQGFETILTDLDVSDQTFALIIEGDSMTPEFQSQDKIIVDPNIEPRPGDFVVAKNTEEEATFKKYRPRGTGEHGQMVFELVPLNDDYPTLHSERDHLRIIGVMVEHRKYRRR